jgi:hypothetical protein
MFAQNLPDVGFLCVALQEPHVLEMAPRHWVHDTRFFETL